jgi:3-methyl-2-oxobutanoate hydroxymethyltransferase
MLGINTEFRPRFLRLYADLHKEISGALERYISDVRGRDFPGPNEQY